MIIEVPKGKDQPTKYLHIATHIHNRFNSSEMVAIYVRYNSGNHYAIRTVNIRAYGFRGMGYIASTNHCSP